MNKYFKWFVIGLFALRTFFSLVTFLALLEEPGAAYAMGDLTANTLLMVYFYKKEKSCK